ncbi:MAG: hypothetical protein KJO23_08285 [Bacteroidia bacterium]|nr:hypothetical protein [Bacteroidia bacterium]
MCSIQVNGKHMAMLDDLNRFEPMLAKPHLDSNPYFLLSNVENRKKDDGIDTLRTEWEEVAH